MWWSPLVCCATKFASPKPDRQTVIPNAVAVACTVIIIEMLMVAVIDRCPSPLSISFFKTAAYCNSRADQVLQPQDTIYSYQAGRPGATPPSAREYCLIRTMMRGFGIIDAFHSRAISPTKANKFLPSSVDFTLPSLPIGSTSVLDSCVNVR